MKILNRWLVDPSRFGLSIILFILALASAPVLAVDGQPATTEPPSSKIDSGASERVQGATVEEIEKAVMYLTKDAPNHPMRRRPELLRELAHATVDAAQANNVDPWLLITVMYCESTFRVGVRGAAGEVGLGQQKGVAAIGCEFGTPAREVNCTARWLAYCRSLCDGSDYEALVRYATGSKCHAEKGGGVDRLVRYRLRILRELDQRI